MIYVTADASVDLFSADKFTVIMIYEKKNICEKKIDICLICQNFGIKVILNIVTS